LTVVTSDIELQTEGEENILDITSKVSEIVRFSGLQSGIVVVFTKGSTGALTTIEYEPGLLEDFPEMLDRVASKSFEYKHERMWHDGNGHSHIRAALIGPSITVPFVAGRLTLGTWQQIVFVELDTRPRTRRLIVQIIGE
jgi:secondary thiamine-phosphate synthase enzyme